MSRIKLQIPQPTQDVPTTIRGAGKACGGDLIVLLKPALKLGLVVQLHKGQPARSWKATRASDAPGKPATEMSEAGAAAAMKELRQVDAPIARSTQRGSWTGFVECDEHGVPQVELRRKGAAYSTIILQSTAGGWRWTVERAPRWFGEGKHLTSKASVPYLTDALGEAMDASIGLVRSACGVRDTTRREATDEAYAAQRKAKADAKPSKPKKAVKDPTERLKPRKAIDKAATAAAAKAAKTAARAEAKATKLAEKVAKSTSGRAARAGERQATLAANRAAKAAAKAATTTAAQEARRAAREAATAAASATREAKPVKEPKPPKAAKPSPAPAAAPRAKKKLTQAEKDGALMAVIAKAMRGIE